MNGRRLWPTVVATLLLCCACAAGDNSAPQAEAARPADVGFVLLALHEEFSQHIAAGHDAADFQSSFSQARIHDGRVLVDLVAADDAKMLADELGKLGATEVAVAGRRGSTSGTFASSRNCRARPLAATSASRCGG